MSNKIDANDIAAEHGLEALRALGLYMMQNATVHKAAPTAGAEEPPTDMPLEPDVPKSYSWRKAVEHNTEDDPDCLLGRRWLSKRGSCLWVGSTGLGKSSLTTQAAACWAIGQDFFGIKPVRPLRSLIIQAENDMGDIAEMARGITNGLDISAAIDLLDANIIFAEDTAVAGDALIPYARKLVNHFKPDLLWIDPLFAFCGCDVSDQGEMSRFLRLGLHKIAQETGVCNMIVHHTNKPRQDAPAVAEEDSYSGSGTAEIANFVRAVIRIKKFGDSGFSLKAAKRGNRTGLTDHTGSPTDSVFLKHATPPDICWLRAEAPESPKAAEERRTAQDIIASMAVGQLYNNSELKKLVIAETGAKIGTISNPASVSFRILNLVRIATLDNAQMGFFKRKS